MQTSHPLRQGGSAQGHTIAAVLSVIIALLLTVLVPSSAMAWGTGSGDDSQPTPTNPGNPPGDPSTGAPTVPKYEYWNFNSTVSWDNTDHWTQESCSYYGANNSTYRGVTFRYRYPYGLGLGQVQNAIRSGQTAMDSLGIERLSSKCLYTGGWRLETIKCVVKSHALISMVQPRTGVLAEAEAYSAFGRGDGSIAACENSATAAEVDLDLTEYGRFTAQAETTVVNMVVRRTVSADQLDGSWAPDAVDSVSAPYVTNPQAKRAQFTCAGFIEDWDTSRSWTFTESDCGEERPPGTPQTYVCSPSGAPTVNGIAGTSEATFFRSGEKNTMVWGPVTISGTGLVSLDASRAATRVLRSGSPSQDGDVEIAQRGGRSLLVNDLSSTYWQSGSGEASYEGYFRWASSAGDPTVITPQWKFHGTWERTSARIVSVDSNGNIKWESTVVRTESDAICSGSPLTLNIVRAVNS